ncbi:alkaline phosphatase D family protein [Jiangella alkaliphila]|uniref:Alkaline phosphatase D n=1 Tax=Jiangella alkaliphila TaxID=419479 RepID=A0A1H2LTN9_9ACTN|nr:alkaline phosphatase D family protein [Jiangella alkaliphila]SDU84373.1 alkaline phosphatase D [Jiangella alkaliphila]
MPASPSTLDRRRFLALTGGGALTFTAALAGFSAAPVRADPLFRDNPFTLGVASGDPLPDGVVLWTRLAPEPLAADGSGGMGPRAVPVQWQLARDPQFRQVERTGTVRATPELAHSVHAEVGGLEPGRDYWYRFRAGRELSPVGRTRTAPAADATPDQVRFAYASCQNYADGYFTAYRHLAEEDLDLVVHLGDYIYEGANVGTIGRAHLPAVECFSLTDYRIRYSQYKSDPDLQAAHAAAPWVVVLDDHEIDNNWADDVDGGGVGGEVFRARRIAALKAYYENMPLRRASMPVGPDMQLYRRLRFGTLADVNVVDTRQYRDDQACGDGRQIDCADRLDPARTMLGDAQEAWLLDGLADSPATWKVMANQIFMMQADHEAGPVQAFGMDTWDGYAAARTRLLDGVRERSVDDFVVITGDAHRSVAADLKANFDDPGSATVGTEFLATSISAGGDGVDQDPLGGVWLAENPHMKFHNVQRGYATCTLTPDAWRTDYRVVPFVRQPGAPVSTRASVHVETGVPGIAQVSS